MEDKDGFTFSRETIMYFRAKIGIFLRVHRVY
jgi:hypothetical protein